MSSEITDSYNSYTIFLNPGVLYGCLDYSKIVNKVNELFQIQNGMWSKKQHFEAVSHLFDPQALNQLNHLISEIQETRSVQIVMTSDWRSDYWSKGHFVSEIKAMLKIHKFAKYIVDKVPEDISLDRVAENCRSQDHLDRYRHEVCKASRIQYWLTKHPQVKNYCILDNWQDKDSGYNGHLSSHFGKSYFRVEYETLLTENIKKNILSVI